MIAQNGAYHMHNRIRRTLAPTLARRSALTGAFAAWCASCAPPGAQAAVGQGWSSDGCDTLPKHLADERAVPSQPASGSAAAHTASTTRKKLGATVGKLQIEVHYFPAHPRDASPDDDPTLPPNEHPDHVKATLAAARAALTAFDQLQLPPPVSSNGVLQIRLVKLDGYRGVADPHPVNAGQIDIERILRGKALNTTVAHEIFHCIQYSYNNISRENDEGQARDGKRLSIAAAMREGGARLGEYLAGDRGERYEDDLDTWFGENPPTLFRAVAGPVDRMTGASYAAALFWKYMAEQHGPTGPDPRRQVADTLQKLMRATAKTPHPPGTGDDKLGSPMLLHQLRTARSWMRGPGHFDQIWHIDAVPVCSETTWGNFLVALALNGKAGADSRFRFADAAMFTGPGEARQVIPPSRTWRLGDLPARDTPARPRRSPDGEPMLRPYAMRSYRVQVAAGQAALLRPAASDSDHPTGDTPPLQPTDTGLLRIRCRAANGLSDMLVQVVFLDRDGRLADLYRHDGLGGRPLDRTFSCHGMSELIVIVASREAAGDYSLALTQADPAPLLCAGGMNTMPGRTLTYDPMVRQFDWMSPHIMLLRGGKPAIGATLFNRGTRTATGVTVECHRRHLSGIGDWEKLPAIDGIALPVVNTLAECAWAAGRPAPPGAIQGAGLPTCAIAPYGADRSEIVANVRAAQFWWPNGNLHDHMLRVTAKTPGDPNGPLVVLSMGAPQKPPGPPAGFVL
jgi:hypothetical protein